MDWISNLSVWSYDIYKEGIGERFGKIESQNGN